MTQTRMTLLCLMLLIAGCGQKAEISTADTVTEAPTLASSAQNASQQDVLRDVYSNGKVKLIKTLNYRFQVDDLKKTTEMIEQLVKKYPAYISDSKLELENPLLENKLTIRVQSEFFQDLVKHIDPLATFVNYRTITTEDVAKEFVDLESRLKTKREVEQRYSDILRKKAGTIPELLEAEQKIGELHEEIEAAVSRINYLKDQVSYSTINLEYYQTITQQLAQADVNSTGDEFREALSAGWNGLMSLVLLLAYLWPALVFAGIAWFIYRFRKRRVIIQN